ncbi:hypothetical protein FEM48_Zijuj12G0130300 [Ziziphus jujuba var. spinosa]|uniref:Uncharacterized protein n=1 Tax=Ziziphus jujuba var. spinosa TaxID=714518 RepID=A0A978UDH5_ZIZJJ|nr:hypothetical protein FEM48_Zijuj12G0130300 [Ziziphus jujuba var. spinosa]
MILKFIVKIETCIASLFVPSFDPITFYIWVIVLKPPPVLSSFEDHFSSRSTLLKASDSRASSRAVLGRQRATCSGLCSVTTEELVSALIFPGCSRRLRLVVTTKIRRGNWANLGDFGLLDLSILYNSRKKKDFVAYPFYANVCELAADMDVLIIYCGVTEQTCHMIDGKVLLGEIGGAGLDVFENEPKFL